MLEVAIVTRWNALASEDRLRIRSFLVEFSVHLAEHAPAEHQFLVTKANAVLVAVAKREWPHRWPSFVLEVASSAMNTPGLLRNNLAILRLLSEELFEFEEKKMTSRWLQRRREALRSDLEAVYDLCVKTLMGNFERQLQASALLTLQNYIAWIAPSFVFRAELLGLLSKDFLLDEATRLPSMRCLHEIAQLTPGSDYSQLCTQTFETVIRVILGMIPGEGNRIEEQLWQLFTNGNEDDRLFLEKLCSFITGFLRNNSQIFSQRNPILVPAHQILIGLTSVDNSVFKDVSVVAVDYWRWWSEYLIVGSAVSGRFRKPTKVTFSDTPMSTSPQRRLADVDLPPLNPTFSNVRQILSPLFENLRLVLVRQMTKPEEVILAPDENGELQMTYLTDVEALQHCTTMKEVLMFMTVLDSTSMCTCLRNLVQQQIEAAQLSWTNLNRICWSIGAISGALLPEEESSFFVAVLRDLLDFCAKINGKENKAVIATNIMYITGQYPRFLLRHPRFFRTVCRKLFDFMKESFPGIKDMAVDTLLKLSKLLPEAFVIDAPSKFASDIIESIDFITCELSEPQVHTFYEAMGRTIAVVQEHDQRSQLLSKLLSGVHSTLNAAVHVASTNSQAMNSLPEMRRLLHVSRTFVAVCKTCGPTFLEHMTNIFYNFQCFYTTFSSTITARIAERGDQMCHTTEVKVMRAIKREFLKLIEFFVLSTDNPEYISKQCWPLLMGPILQDYNSSVPAAREALVLSVIAACVEKLKGHLESETGTIMSMTFDCTKEMIAANFQDFPDHRLHLFRLLEALNRHCFDGLVQYATQNQDVIHGMLWACRHSETSVMISGLNTLHRFLQQMVHSSMAESFMDAYLTTIMVAILEMMTDSLHSAGFQKHCEILALLFSASSQQQRSDSSYHQKVVGNFLVDKLGSIHSLTKDQIVQFVVECFRTCGQPYAFQTMLADFLIEVQVWGAAAENRLLEDSGNNAQSRRASDAAYGVEEEIMSKIQSFLSGNDFAVGVPHHDEDGDEIL